MKFTDVTRQGRKLLKLKYCGAVIVAAGSASRMGGIDKVMAELDGEPMVVKSVRAFHFGSIYEEADRLLSSQGRSDPIRRQAHRHR